MSPENTHTTPEVHITDHDDSRQNDDKQTTNQHQGQKKHTIPQRIKNFFWFITRPIVWIFVGIMRGVRWIIVTVSAFLVVVGLIALVVFGVNGVDNSIFYSDGNNVRTYEDAHMMEINSDDKDDIISFSLSDKEHTDPIYLAIDVRGVILGMPQSERDAFLAENITYGMQLQDALYNIADHIVEEKLTERVGGLIVTIDSPGGTIHGTYAIVDGIDYFRRTTGLPVYGDIVGSAFSGGYWVASVTDALTARVGTMVGSVGVITGPLTQLNNLVALDNGLLGPGYVTTEGIEQRFFTAGDGKDLGNPFRAITPQEEQILQANVDRVYDSMVISIATARDVSANRVITEWGAYVYDAMLGVDNNMVDAIGMPDLPDDAYRLVSLDAGSMGFGSRPAFAMHSLVGSPHNSTASICAAGQSRIIQPEALQTICAK